MTVEEAEAKDFSNIETTIRSVIYKIDNTIFAERILCVDDGAQNFGCLIESTPANEIRGFSGRTESGTESAWNLTLNYIDEQQARLSVISPLTIDPIILVNGSQLVNVAINNVNVTLGGNFWTYNGGNQINRIELFQGGTIAENFTVFFPQDNFTAFATLGRTLEGNFVTGLNFRQIEKFINIAELFNPDSSKVSKVKQLLDNDREKIYTIILKVLKDKFDISATKVKQIMGNYLDHYKTEANIDNFLDKLETFTRSKIPDDLP